VPKPQRTSVQCSVGTMMSVYRNICVLSILLLHSNTCIAVAVSIPDELIGKWSASTGEHCAIQFTATGFTDLSEGEGYGCQAKSIRTLADVHLDPTWSMVFVCEGEFGTVQVNSLIRLQTINGKRVVRRADTLRPQDAKKVAMPPLSILYKCR
jgi:hypothetical protein